jgi:hypothetical protein
MWGRLLVATMVIAFAGCEAPSDPAPPAAPDPLEEAIARGQFPDRVAEVLRQFARMPDGIPAAEAERLLRVSPDDGLGGEGNAHDQTTVYRLAPGYHLTLVVDITPWYDGRPAELAWAEVQVPIGSDERWPRADYTTIFPIWSGGRLHYRWPPNPGPHRTAAD